LPDFGQVVGLFDRCGGFELHFNNISCLPVSGTSPGIYSYS
jgi:hypothetical protein